MLRVAAAAAGVEGGGDAAGGGWAGEELCERGGAVGVRGALDGV